MTSISFRTALRGQIFVAIGALGAAAAMGCGDDTGSGGSGAGGGAGGGGQGAQAPGGGGNGGSSDGGSPIAGGGGAGGLGQGGDNEGGGGEGEQNVERCFTNLNPDAECPSLADAAGVYPCTDLGEVVGAWLSGPAEQDTLCCYQVDVGPDNDRDCGAVGRPLVVDERAQRAGVRGARDPRRAWGAASSVAPDVSRLSLGERALLARAWARDATYEHASVASFSKFALELLACGAPAELLRGAHEAALDEVRHAELAFSLASAYAGRSLEPARLEAAARVECARTPEALIEAVIAEGCVGETLAAIVASAQHEAATDVGVRAALAVIARDEAQHAELAWRTVAWAIDALGDGLKVTAQRAFERAIEQAMNATAPDEAALHAHGRLSSDEARFERHRAVREIVVPSAAALLRV